MTTSSPATGGVNFASIVATSTAASSTTKSSSSTPKKSNQSGERKSFKTANPNPVHASTVSSSPLTSSPSASNGTELPRRPNPVNAAYDQKVNELDAKLTSLKRKLEDLKNDAYGSSEGNQETRNTRNSLRAQLRDLNAKLDAVDEDKKKLQTDLTNLKEAHTKQMEAAQAAKDKLPVKSIEEVDRRISQLEASIEQGGITLKDEKNTLQEISKLRKNRKTLEALESGRAAAIDPAIALKTKVDMIKDRLDGKWTESKQLRKDISGVKDGLKALDGNKDEAERRQKEREEQIAQLKSQLDVAYAEKRQAYEDFKKKKAERAAAYERNQAKREEQRQRHELEDQIDALYKKLRSIDPKTTADQQLNECVNVSNYFTQLISSAISAAEKHAIPTTEPHPGIRKPDIPNSDEWTAIKIKAHKDDVYYAPPETTSKGKKTTSSNNQSLTHKHPIQILGALGDLGFVVPKDVTQAKDLLVQLGRRRELIEENRDKALESVRTKQQEVQKEIDILKTKLEALSVSNKKSNKTTTTSEDHTTTTTTTAAAKKEGSDDTKKPQLDAEEDAEL